MDPSIDAAFSGTYALTSVDGAPLPTTIVTGSAARSMNVQQGQLLFEGLLLTLNITGPLDGTGSPVTLSTGASYNVVGSDSLQGSTGVNGRAWPDSADITTLSSTLAGAHRFRFTRSN